MSNNIFQDYGDVLKQVKTTFITRNVETSGPEPLLDDLAAEFDIPLATIRTAFVREDWDLLREENLKMFKHSYLKAREAEIDNQALDLAKEMSSIMRRRINFVKEAGVIVDSRITEILNDPEQVSMLKISELIKLKELLSKEDTAITDVGIKLQEKLNRTPESDIKAVTSAEYLAQLRTAIEVARAMKGDDINDPPEAAELFKRLDAERGE